MSDQTKFRWSDECTTAFNKLKLLLTNNLQLVIFDSDYWTILATDASNLKPLYGYWCNPAVDAKPTNLIDGLPDYPSSTTRFNISQGWTMSSPPCYHSCHNQCL
uniref:Reverse transcriptase/retrotransposon-derived protein RNase H-like domain-containing protein n=1 Tax=Romanomermis culicivorax TaxID=13658 RepID=A0A915HNY7_ROMCU